IGIASAADVKGISGAETALWAGETVSANDALVMYTYGGDANLDGKIDVSDYGRIDFNAPLQDAGWFDGDFNYDGKIDISDYGIIDFNVGIQGAPFSTAGSMAATESLAIVNGVTAIPEPAAFAFISCLSTGLLSRRSRSRRSPSRR